MRGRKPKPSRQHELEGTVPQRKRPAEPRIATGSTSCPAFVSDHARQEWRRLYPILAGSGVVTSADRSTLAVHVEALSDYRQATVELRAHLEKYGTLYYQTKAGSLKVHPAALQKRAAAEVVIRTAAELGCTPSARSRVAAVERQAGDDTIDKYLLTGGPEPVAAADAGDLQ